MRVVIPTRPWPARIVFSINVSGTATTGGAFTRMETITALVLGVPGKTVLTSPIGSISTNHPMFSWTRQNDTSEYNLSVTGPDGNVVNRWYSADQAGCSSVNDTTCTLTPDIFLIGGTYSWWVQGRNQINLGPKSDGRSFIVPKQIPTSAELLSPVGEITTIKPYFMWKKVPTAQKYFFSLYPPSGKALLNQRISRPVFVVQIPVRFYPLKTYLPDSIRGS